MIPRPDIMLKISDRPLVVVVDSPSDLVEMGVVLDRHGMDLSNSLSNSLRLTTSPMKTENKKENLPSHPF
jgi:hypothetical protein